MSSEVTYLQRFVPSLPPPPTIMVGNSRISQLFFQTIQQYGSTIPVETDPVVECGEESIFARDRGIAGLNHTYLLPYPIEEEDEYLFQAEFKAHLPESSRYYINSSKNPGMGSGFDKEYVVKALSYVKEHNLPHRQLHSTIEGGNCYVFFDLQDHPKAIVGSHSLALTLLGLEKQKYFEEEEPQKTLQTFIDTIDSPSDEAVRKARNTSLFARQKKWCDRRDYLSQHRSEMDPQEVKRYQAALRKERTMPGGISDYEKLLSSPLTQEDRVLYREEGRIWEAKMRLACQVIADDLGVPLENIAFVSQRNFHIDMDMFVAPNGDVYLDEGAASPSVMGALQKIGCRVVLVPGVHKVGIQSINFMNGVFVSTPLGPLFITNGTEKDEESIRLRDLFVRTVANNNHGFRIHFLDETQEILTQYSGGIHCLTWERVNYATPLDIILLGYLADEPIPQQRIRQCAGEVLASLDTPLYNPL